MTTIIFVEHYDYYKMHKKFTGFTLGFRATWVKKQKKNFKLFATMLHIFISNLRGKKTWHVAKQSWRMTIKTSVPTEDHQLWRLQQWWSLDKRHFAEAALKFCSWQSSLQVRKETGIGTFPIAHACKQSHPYRSL